MQAQVFSILLYPYSIKHLQYAPIFCQPPSIMTELNIMTLLPVPHLSRTHHQCFLSYQLRLNNLLNLWVDAHHLLPSSSVLIEENLGVERHTHEKSACAALYRHKENVADLEAYQKGKCHDRRGVVPAVKHRIVQPDVEVCE